MTCPWIHNGRECSKKGYLILEPPRKKQRRRSKRYTNEKHKEYDISGRPRGRYFRVHHYVNENGKRKSKFCYLGNFEGAVKKLKQIQIMSEGDKNYQKEKVESDIKLWIDSAVKMAEKIDVNNLQPTDVDDIFVTILNARLCIIRNGYVWQKYH